MAAAKAARRNTTVNDLYLLNDPFQDPCIGRRTGVPLNIRARKDSHGFDNIDDYFPDSDPEEENVVPNEQESSDKDLLVGRRTGIPLNINPRKDSKGFELVDDYFPDPEGETDGPTEHGDHVEDLAENTSRIAKELQAAKTPEGVVDSPEDTGTIIKLPASREPTPQSNEPIKKRILQDDAEAITDKAGESDSEIDVVGVVDDSQADHQQSYDLQSCTANKGKGVVAKQKATNTKQKTSQRNTLTEDDVVIDVEEIEEEETFLTIGNTARNAGLIVVDKSPISAEAESFVMSESFVLEGTKHKTMSPEYGSCSDSQPEQSDLPAVPTEKKSKIPVRKKGVPIGARQKGTRGKKKVEESRDVEQGAVSVKTGGGKGQSQGGNKPSVKGQPDTKQRFTRGKRKKFEEIQNEETEVAEGLDSKSNKGDGDDKAMENGSKFLNGRIQNTKRRGRGRQKNVAESENVEQETEEAQHLENDDEDHVEGGDDLMNSDKDQNKLSSVDEERLADSKVVEAQIREAEKKVQRRAKSLPGTEQPLTNTRKAKKSDNKAVVVSDEELLVGDKRKGSIEDDRGERQRRGRKNVSNTKHEEKKVTRGRKREVRENLECDVDDEDDDSDGEKAADQKTQSTEQQNDEVDPLTKKGAETKKNQKQGKSVTEGSAQAGGGAAKLSGRKTRAQRKKEAGVKLNREQDKERDTEGGVEDGSEEVELSGRKTRGQRKREADTKLSREDGSREKRDGDTQDAPEDSDIKGAAEGGDMASEETTHGEKEYDGGDQVLNNDREQTLETVVQRKGKPGKAKDVNETESQGKLDDLPSKRRGKKSLRDQTAGQDLVDEVEVSSKARKGEIGEGKGTTGSLSKGQEDFIDAIGGLDEDNPSANLTHQESVGSSSSVSSNASSNSESKRKTGSKRRKHSSLLPPYIRRANKSKSLKSSLTVNSHDSTTESELRIDAKKPRLEEGKKQSNIVDATSNKGDAIGSRKGGRALQTGRKSAGRKKSVTQAHKTRKTEATHNKSAASSQSNGKDDDASAVADADAHEAHGKEDDNGSVQEAGGVEGRSFQEIPPDDMTPRPFPAPSAKSDTALKSILKSGGRIGRINAASRKRQMNPDKSHSGGSDADDESAQPAKQANRKRLSTVSFASSPFVRESPPDLTPSEASRLSPLAGLSFVSNGSSYLSTDGSFAPGSGRTVRSSVGSATGVSSAAELDIDPEEEITLTNDDKQQEDEQGARRSKRTIVPPLQYWMNERIDYERRKSGGWRIKGVIRNPTPTPKIRKKPKSKRPTARKQNHVSSDSSEEEGDNEELEGFQEITNPTSTVFNPEKNEDVEMDLFHAPGMLKFTNPAGKPATDDDPLVVHKFVSQPLFGGGQVILRPGAEKGRQFVRNDTMVFYVIKGKIMVTVHQSSVVLNTGSTFFVPQGNSYNIKNLKQTEAKLMFVQIKG